MALTTQEAKKPPPPETTKTMAESTASGGQAPESHTQVWERPWTIDEMRKAANDWSLAGDAGMLQYLQDFSQRIISQTHDIQEQVNGLVHESKLTGTRVQNAFNDFIMLANTQFVENRVYDEDVNTESTNEAGKKSEEKEKTREEKEAILIPKINEAMKLGFNVIETAFEKLDVNEVNSDSEDDEESPYKTDTILEAKDPYISRPLPYLIGSQAFMTDDDVGLTDLPSEEEESDHGSISESESETESEDEQLIQKGAPTARKQTVLDTDSDSDDTDESESESEEELFGAKDKDSDVSSLSEEDEKPKVDAPTDFASQLAAKLGNAESKAEKKEKKQSENKKDRSASKSKPPVDDDEDLFGPPPMEDEDSPFGKKGGLFSTSSGLFDNDSDNEGGGLFDDIVAEKPKPKPTTVLQPQAHEDSEEEEDEKPPELQERPRTKSGRKVPAGGVSIFSGGDDDLFAGIKAKKAAESEEEEEVAPPKSEPVKSAKKPALGGGGGGLFDDDDDDLFSAAAAAPPAKKAAPKKDTPAVDLFGGEDDDGDLFAAIPAPAKKQPAKPETKPTAKAPPKPKSMFDDEEEDLFGSTAAIAPPSKKSEPPKEETKPQKKLPAGAVSMFGGNVNPLAAAVKAQRPPSDNEESDEDWGEDEDKASISSSRSGASSHAGTRPTLLAGGKKKSPSVSSNSLFAEEPESDFLTSSAMSKPTEPNTRPPSKAKVPASSSGLFGGDSDEEDLFAATTAPKPKTNQAQTKPKPTKSSLFFDDKDEEDGSLFSAPSKTTTTKTKIEPAISGARPKPANKGMFDDDDGDLFAEPKQKEQPAPPKETQKSQPVPQGNRSRGGTTLSLFDDDEEDDGDLFGGGSKAPTTTTKPKTQKPPAQPTTLDTKGGKPRTRSLFADEDVLFGAASEDPSVDLFGANSPLSPGEESKLLPGATTAQKPKLSHVSQEPAPPEAKLKDKVEVKGATISASSTDLFTGLEDDGDIFSTEPAAPHPKPTEEDPKVEVKGATTSESSTDKSAKKKPVGGVSMFGGMDPTAMLKKRSDSPKKDSTTAEPKPTPLAPEPSPVEEDGPLGDIKPKTKPLPPKMPKPQSSTSKLSIGKLQANLVINPSALLPGATPPLKEAAPVAVGFDEPMKASTLHTVQKERVKGQSKRRPPTRKSRVITSPSSDDLTNSTSPPPQGLDHPENPPSTTAVPITSQTPARKSDPFNDDETDIFSGSRSNSSLSKVNNGVLPPLRNDDLFSDSSLLNSTSSTKPANIPNNIFSDSLAKSTKPYSKVRGPLDSPSKDQDSNSKNTDGDIFTSNTTKKPPPPAADSDEFFGSAPPKSSTAKPKVTKPVLDFSDDDDIFASAGAGPPPLPPSDDEDEDDDIFANSSLAPKSLSRAVVDNDDDDDDDIFATNIQKKTAPVSKVDGNTFSASASTAKASKPKNTTPAVFEDNTDDDLFGVSSKPPSSSKKKLINPASKSAPALDDDNIFGDLPSGKSAKKKITKKSEDKNMFGDDGDDIFAESNAKPKAKKSGASKKKPATSNIFGNDDDVGDIFSDPLRS